MATVAFTESLRRHVECPTVEAPGATVREVLENVFASNERLRSWHVVGNHLPPIYSVRYA